MVESLSELNNICQKPHYKEVGNWMVRKILRPAALPITWLLLHTSVTANQVTLASLLIGLLGIGLCGALSTGGFLTGMLFLQFWYLLDHVDGQIARYRGTSGLTGRFFDFLMHHILHGAFFFAIGCYIYRTGQSFFFVFWGFVTAFCMTSFNLLQDVKYKTFFEKLAGFSQIAIRQELNQESPEEKTSETSQSRKIFSFLHKSIEMHVLMNVFTGAALLQAIVLHGFDGRSVLFLYYGIVVPVCFVAKTFYWIHSRKIDSEFDSLFDYNQGKSLEPPK